MATKPEVASVSLNNTDDFMGHYAGMTAAGVAFLEEPGQEAYGTVVVFEDLYGDRWGLIQQTR